MISFELCYGCAHLLIPFWCLIANHFSLFSKESFKYQQTPFLPLLGRKSAYLFELKKKPSPQFQTMRQDHPLMKIYKKKLNILTSMTSWLE